jgi:hypothetical protein
VRKDDIINENLSQDSSLEEGKSPIYTSEVSIKVIDIAKSLVIAEIEPQLGKSNHLNITYG